MGKDEIKKININGTDYYTIDDFALVTNRTKNAVYVLIKRGNKIRKLKNFVYNRVQYVPASELTEFPFSAGKSHFYYKFNGDGTITTIDNIYQE